MFEMMAASHKAFMELARLYMSTGDVNDWDEAVERESVEEDPLTAAPIEEPMVSIEEPDGTCVDFPLDGYPAFTEDMINLDDPRFLGGFSIGIPMSVYKNAPSPRGGPGDRLLPIVGGLFREV